MPTKCCFEHFHFRDLERAVCQAHVSLYAGFGRKQLCEQFCVISQTFWHVLALFRFANNNPSSAQFHNAFTTTMLRECQLSHATWGNVSSDLVSPLGSLPMMSTQMYFKSLEQKNHSVQECHSKNKPRYVQTADQISHPETVHPKTRSLQAQDVAEYLELIFPCSINRTQPSSTTIALEKLKYVKSNISPKGRNICIHVSIKDST